MRSLRIWTVKEDLRPWHVPTEYIHWSRVAVLGQLAEHFSTLVGVVLILRFVFPCPLFSVEVLIFIHALLITLVFSSVEVAAFVPSSYGAFFSFLIDWPSSSASSECALFIAILSWYGLSPDWKMGGLFGLGGVRSNGGCLVEGEGLVQ